MRKQLYMWRHSKNLVPTLNGARNSPNNADRAWNQNLSGAIYDLQKKMREMNKRYCIIWMFIWIMLLIYWPELACLNTEVQFQSQADCNETSVLTVHDKSHWPDSGFTRLFFSVNLSLLLFHVLRSCLGCEMTVIALRETAIACRWVVALCTRLQMNIWPAYWFHVWKRDPSE